MRTKNTLWALLALLAFSSGCASKSTTKLREENAYLRGQLDAAERQRQQQLQQQPTVFFTGLVRQTRVPWREGMTLSQGLAQAQFTGTSDPSTLRILRTGQIHTVDVRRLLRGQEDPVLEVNDVVEVTR
jgi:hypothetical protein